MPTYKTLMCTHPDLDRERLSLLRALYDGGPKLRPFVKTLFPISFGEEGSLYAERVARVRYTNRAASMIDLMTAQIVKSPPVVSGLKPETVARLTDDADSAGTSLAELSRLLLLDTMQTRRSFAWIDTPPAPSGVVVRTRADEERAGLHLAYIRRVDPLAVLNWSETRGVLNWIVIHDTRTEQSGPLTGQVKVWRWQVIERTAIGATLTVYEWSPATPDGVPRDDDNIPQAGPTVALSRMPIAMYEVPDGMWLMGRMEDAILALLTAENDYRWYLWRTAVCLLKIKRQLAPMPGATGGGAAPTAGAGYTMDLGPSDDADFIAPPAAAAVPLADERKEAELALYRVVHQMSAGTSSTAATQRQSGESKRFDAASAAALLSAYADALRNLLREVFRIVAATTGDAAPEAVAVGGLDDLGAEDVAAWMDAAAAAVEVKRSPTAVAMIARKQAAHLFGPEIPADVLDQIEAEVSATAGAEAEASALAGGGGDEDADEPDDTTEEEPAGGDAGDGA